MHIICYAGERPMREEMMIVMLFFFPEGMELGRCLLMIDFVGSVYVPS